MRALSTPRLETHERKRSSWASVDFRSAPQTSTTLQCVLHALEELLLEQHDGKPTESIRPPSQFALRNVTLEYLLLTPHPLFPAMSALFILSTDAPLLRLSYRARAHTRALAHTDRKSKQSRPP